MAVIIAALWFNQTFKKLTPQQRPRFIFKAFIYVVIGVVLLGVLTGRVPWLGAAVAALIPFMRWGLFGASRLLPFWLRRTGGNIHFKTEHLDVAFNIHTGQMQGKIIKGPHVDQLLQQLTDAERTELMDYYRERDAKSYYLIKMLRTQTGAEQATQQDTPSPPSFGNPSHDEALSILGLSGHPTREEIITAHRRLINKLHPDRGGSDFLAARVNQARDILLKKF